MEWSDAVGVALLLLTGAVGGSVVTGLLAQQRERVAARRDRLGNVLADFYGPVAVKLELAYRWNEKVRLERAKRDPSEPVPSDSPEREVELKLVQANIRLRTEVTGLVEQNLHVVDEPELRDAALDWMSESHIHQWTREASNVEQLTVEGKGIILFPKEQKPRSQFHELTAAAFTAKGEEYRQLAKRGNRRDRA